MLGLELTQAFIFLAAGFAICALFMTISLILRPNRPSRDKLLPYECGELPIGPGQFRLNFRFHTVALIFLIFDVELVALLPPVVLFRDVLALYPQFSVGLFAEIFAFVGILMVGLLYVWRKGDLDWIKDVPEDARGDF